VFNSTKFKKYVKNTILKPANYSKLLLLIDTSKDFEELSNKLVILLCIFWNFNVSVRLTEDMHNTANNSGLELVHVQKLVGNIMIDSVEPIYNCDAQLTLFIKWFGENHSIGDRNKELKKMKSSNERRMSTMFKNIKILLYGKDEVKRLTDLYNEKKKEASALRGARTVATVTETLVTTAATTNVVTVSSADNVNAGLHSRNPSATGAALLAPAPTPAAPAQRSAKPLKRKKSNYEARSDNSSSSDSDDSVAKTIPKQMRYGPFGRAFLGKLCVYFERLLKNIYSFVDIFGTYTHKDLSVSVDVVITTTPVTVLAQDHNIIHPRPEHITSLVGGNNYGLVELFFSILFVLKSSKTVDAKGVERFSGKFRNLKSLSFLLPNEYSGDCRDGLVIEC
jgi:hypothetical protein